MAHPRMDDTAYLTSLLTEWGAPATLQAALTAGGFTTLATVAFAAEEGSDEAPVIRALLRITDDPLPVTPAIAQARRLIHFATAAAGRTPSPPVVASPASLLPGAAVPKLTAEVAKDLRAKFLSRYPGELLSPELTPSCTSCSTCGQRWTTKVSSGFPGICALQRRTLCAGRRLADLAPTSSCSLSFSRTMTLLALPQVFRCLDQQSPRSGGCWPFWLSPLRCWVMLTCWPFADSMNAFCRMLWRSIMT